MNVVAPAVVAEKEIVDVVRSVSPSASPVRSSSRSYRWTSRSAARSRAWSWVRLRTEVMIRRLAPYAEEPPLDSVEHEAEPEPELVGEVVAGSQVVRRGHL